MKKLLLSSLLLLSGFISFGQTTATNFNVNDCAGNNHDLFSELDSGKVIVLVWAMPCPACVNPSKTAYNAVQPFASSHPGRVFFYLSDDYGSPDWTATSCAAMNTWANDNAMPNSIEFANSAVTMANYGTSGMPKVTVLGCASHTIFYNQNGSATTSTGVTNAINQALACGTGISNSVNSFSTLNLFPNPANSSTAISYSLGISSDVTIAIYNVLGEKVKNIFSGKQNAGDYKFDVDCAKLNNGIYFVKLTVGEIEKTTLLSVAH